MASAFTSFVAVGDSFTEGMDDPCPGGGGFRGWADLAAERLAADRPGLRYANLAVRGKLIGQILHDQVPVAAAMRPDLVTLAGGLNDVMRPRCDMGLVTARIEECTATLAAAAGRLVLFRAPDPTRRLRGSARLMPRIEQLITLIDELAARHDALVVDLFSARVFDDPRLWSIDRIHLSTEGHRRVAEALLGALAAVARPSAASGPSRSGPAPGPRHDTPAEGPAGEAERAADGAVTPVPPMVPSAPPAEPAWHAALPVLAPTPWLGRRRADLRWARVHLLPWIGRRLRGTSSGDGRVAKRPELLPLLPAVLPLAEDADPLAR